jgi:hypothetical protein
MLNKLRIALAAILVALAAVSVVGSASAQSLLFNLSIQETSRTDIVEGLGW